LSARVAIVVYDGVEPIDVGATFGVLSMARPWTPGSRCSWWPSGRG
jgi:hypothetical protein